VEIIVLPALLLTILAAPNVVLVISETVQLFALNVTIIVPHLDVMVPQPMQVVLLVLEDIIYRAKPVLNVIILVKIVQVLEPLLVPPVYPLTKEHLILLKVLVLVMIDTSMMVLTAIVQHVILLAKLVQLQIMKMLV
jgi:hypothetical protein